MENKSGEQFIIMQSAIEPRKQEYDEKMMKLTEYFKEILAAITDQIKTSKYFPNHEDPPKPPDHTTVFPVTGGIHHWMLDSLQKWWHVESIT